MSWPAQSKGIFYDGYKKGATPGRGGQERSGEHKTATGRPLDAKGRMVYPVRNRMTAEGMRKPK